MFDKEQILESHKKRIFRAGPKLWKYVSNLCCEDIVTGKKALDICNAYGLKMTDLMFFFDILGVKYDFDEWYRLEEEQQQQLKKMKQC